MSKTIQVVLVKFLNKHKLQLENPVIVPVCYHGFNLNFFWTKIELVQLYLYSSVNPLNDAWWIEISTDLHVMISYELINREMRCKFVSFVLKSAIKKNDRKRVKLVVTISKRNFVSENCIILLENVMQFFSARIYFFFSTQNIELKIMKYN